MTNYNLSTHCLAGDRKLSATIVNGEAPKYNRIAERELYSRCINCSRHEECKASALAFKKLSEKLQAFIKEEQ